MDKKEVKNLIKTEFKSILEEYNFKKKRDTLYVKSTEKNVLQIINFDLGSIGFTCTVALQPLYVLQHTDGISLNMGERLSRLKIVQNEWWSYDKPKEGINQIKELLVMNGLPWFENYGTPDGIIEFISTNRYKEYGFVAFNSFYQKRNLAFSLLYIGKIQEGIKQVEELISEIKDNAASFMLDYKKQLLDLLDSVRNEPDKLQDALNIIIMENKNKLKL